MSNLDEKKFSCFENIKRIRSDGSEYWSARELAYVLKLVSWKYFKIVIDRAMMACENSGFDKEKHFTELTKKIEIGNGIKRSINDFQLTRYACNLFVHNCNPRDEAVALAQTYFAVQSFRQDIECRVEQLDDDGILSMISGGIKKRNQFNRYMDIAVEEQKKCRSYPKVGAVIVKEEKVLSKAYRGEVNDKHAERIAIEQLSHEELLGSILLTTLEPCVELYHEQDIPSCADLIIECGISEVIIGILDPRGDIYCEGVEKLVSNGIKVNFFTPEQRETIEINTFKYGDCGIGYGPAGKRWVGIFGSGKNFEIQFSPKDKRAINFKWGALQFSHGVVDLVLANQISTSVTYAKGISSFDDISDPLVFREPSYYLRMRKDDIAVVRGPFIVLVKLKEITKTDIYFQWQVRDG